MASLASWLRGAAFSVAALGAVIGLVPGAARAQDTIKVGILHSLSGTMAINATRCVSSSRATAKASTWP